MGRAHRAVMVVCLFAVAVSAQEFRATLNGTVTDRSGAGIPGATVTIRNLDTNEAATAATEGEGKYTIPFLKPGVYSLSVEAPGFKKYTLARQQLEVSQTATRNVQLDIGSQTETVTVYADSSMLDDSKADRGTVIDNARVTELPLNARNPLMLSMLVAGVNYNGEAIYQRPFDNGAIANWSVNGGQSGNNEFLLDGAPNNSIRGGNNVAYVPPVDAVSEFKIVTNSYDAQYGRTSGGVINVSLKSGTNKFHGSAYEFARRNFLDANSLIANFRGLPTGRERAPDGSLIKAEHYLDQYGFLFDGPVVLPKLYNGREKTFFLFNIEFYREGTPNSTVRTAPLEAFLRGDFRELKDRLGHQIVIYDPATGQKQDILDKTGKKTGETVIRTPFPDNIIPPERIHLIASKLVGFYPKPNGSTPGGDPWRNNYIDIPNIAYDTFHNWVMKIDQNIGDRDRLFFRYAYNIRHEMRWTNGIRTGPAQDGQLPLIRENFTGVIDWIHTFSPKLLLNLRSSANRYVEIGRNDAELGFDATALGFSKTLVDQFPIKLFPRVNVQDYLRMGRSSFGVEPTNVFGFQPNMTWIGRGHTMRFGLDMRLQQYSSQNSGNAGMTLDFNRDWTRKEHSRGGDGFGLASFLLGLPTGGKIDFNTFNIYMWKYYAPWFQDDWKVSKRLTLNLGLRWDLNLPVHERYHRLNYAFDFESSNPVQSRISAALAKNPVLAEFPALANLRGGLRFTGVNGMPETPYEPEYDNFQPRIGFAYRLNNKTVLRGGFGRYYMNPTGVTHRQGFDISTPMVTTNDEGLTPAFDLSNPFPNGVLRPPGSSLGLETFLGRGISYANPRFRIPFVQNFSLGLQRAVGWNTLLEVSYVGSRTYRQQSEYGGINEPSLELRNRCDMLLGGDAGYCDELLPNPFFGVPGFEETSRFTSKKLSRWELSRPFPQFGAIKETERNDGRIWYNSLQVVVNKRLSKGLTINGTYTFSKMVEQWGWLDELARIPQRGLYWGDRPHRVTLSGVYHLPIGRGHRFLSNMNGVFDRMIGGWEVAGLFVRQSGRPWDLPDNLSYVRDASIPPAQRRRMVNGTEFIQGVTPCVAQYQRDLRTRDFLRDSNGKLLPPVLTANSVSYGCTEPNFVVREAYHFRETPFRDPHVRRPGYTQFDMNFAKNVRVTDTTHIQLRVELFNLTNTPMYDERNYNNTWNNSEFGSINKNTVFQSNFPRFIQLGAKFVF